MNKFIAIEDYILLCNECCGVATMEFLNQTDLFDSLCTCKSFINHKWTINEDYKKIINFNEIKKIECIASMATKGDEPHFFINDKIYCNIFEFGSENSFRKLEFIEEVFKHLNS